MSDIEIKWAEIGILVLMAGYTLAGAAVYDEMAYYGPRVRTLGGIFWPISALVWLAIRVCKMAYAILFDKIMEERELQQSRKRVRKLKEGYQPKASSGPFPAKAGNPPRGGSGVRPPPPKDCPHCGGKL